MEYSLGYPEGSKKENNRITSLQETNKKLLESIQNRLLALILPGPKSRGTGKSCLAFMSFDF